MISPASSAFDSGPPAVVPLWQIDLGEHCIDHAVDDGVLVGHVMMDRHWLGTEVDGELADCQCIDTDRVGQFDRSRNDSMVVESSRR